jgi:hypothetical protein
MDTLLNELNSFELYRFKYNKCLNSYKNKNKFLEAVIHRKINKLLQLCDELLIDGSGKCNWENIKILNKNGYSVGPGEKDRFGWLTGVVETKKGYIVYG